MNGERYGETMREIKKWNAHTHTSAQNCNVVIWNSMLFNRTEESRQRKPRKKNVCGKNVSTHHFTRVFLYLTVFYCVPLFVVRFRANMIFGHNCHNIAFSFSLQIQCSNVRCVLMHFNYWICIEDMHNSFIAIFFNRTISALQITYHCISECIKGLHFDAGSYSTEQRQTHTVATDR